MVAPANDNDPEGGGMYRLGQAERSVRDMTSKLADQTLRLALLTQEVHDFMNQMREREAEKTREREAEQKRRDEWEDNQEKRTGKMIKVGSWALASLGAMVIGLLGNALILLTRGGA